MTPMRLLAGVVLLLFGRQVFWVFVGALGFVLGMDLAGQLMPQGGPMVLVVALAVGIIGALFAYLFYKLAIADAGFLAGGRIGIALAASLTPLSEQATWLVFVVAGVVAALLLVVIFDWALIALS